MLELSPSQFHSVLPLLDDCLGGAVLPRAVLQGVNPGWVFADDPFAPTRALIGLPCGYFYAAGRPPQPVLFPGLAALLRQGLVERSLAAGNRGFLLCFSSPDWAACLPELLPGRSPLRIFRRTFRFDPPAFAALEASLGPLPPGFELRPIDAALLQDFPELDAEVAGSWRDRQDFLRHGLGVCILRDSQLASYCLSPFACREALEISVATAPPFRRAGLARHCASAFLRRCLDSGRRPNWECFWDNLPSVNLALSLGYRFDQDLPVFYWEEI